MLSRKVITSKIADIRKSAKSIRGRIQTCALHIAAHAFDSGDISQATDLFRAMGTGSNQKALVKWFCDVGLAKFDGKAGTFKVNKAARNAAREQYGTAKAFLEALAMERNFWEQAATAAEIAKELDAAKRVLSLASAIDKAVENGVVVKLDVEAIANARAALDNALEAAAAA